MAEDNRTMDRTEKATPKRRREVRKKGRVAKSLELNSVLMLISGLLLISFFHPHLVGGLKKAFAGFFYSASSLEGLDYRFEELLVAGISCFYRIVAPVFIGTVLIAVAANASQVGFHITPASLGPKLDRLNPVEGLKKILAKRSIIELVKGVLKLLLVGLIAFATYRSRIDDLLRFTFFTPDSILPESARIAAALLIRVILALGVLALFDYAYQRWEFERSIMMTKQEVKEELKEAEGEPLIRARIKSTQQKLSRARMMEGMTKADVIVVKSTSYAIAIGYTERDPAPRVLAKGRNGIAERIEESARDHKIPIVERPLLAPVLYKDCHVGEQIPAALYKAVAEVLAYAYSLRKGEKN